MRGIRHGAARLTAVTVLALGLASCGGSGAPATEAPADTTGWRPWVLASPAELSVPASARRLEARIPTRPPDPARWRVTPTVAPWFELAMRFVSERTKDPPAGSRAYALVGIATHDAALAAAHVRSRDAGVDPSHGAAVAGAASRVLAHAFPEHPAAALDALAERAAAAHAAEGVDRRDAAAGLALGRAVAERVVARVDGDRTAQPAGITGPGGTAHWAPPPGSTARPVQPRAGGWTTWLLPSGDAVRPGPPPRFGSAAFRAEAREVMRVKRTLTAEQRRIARFWEGGEGTELPPGIWVRAVLAHLRDRGIDGVRATRTMSLVTAAMADAGVAAWDAKYAYWSPRPENAIRDLGLDRDWSPLLDTPFFPAYPSGHATYSGAAAEILAHLFPGMAEVWRAKALEASVSRLYGGIHYRSDNDVGLRMGREIGRLAARRAQRDATGR